MATGFYLFYNSEGNKKFKEVVRGFQFFLDAVSPLKKVGHFAKKKPNTHHEYSGHFHVRPE